MFKISRDEMVKQSNEIKYNGEALLETLQSIMDQISKMGEEDETKTVKALKNIIMNRVHQTDNTSTEFLNAWLNKSRGTTRNDGTLHLSAQE
jgi:hypothetical protein